MFPLTTYTLPAEIQSPKPDWSLATLAKLMQHIVDTHHEYLRAELPALDESLGRAASGAVPATPLVLDLHRTVRSLKRDLELQIRKEEAILFPAIAELEDSSAQDSRPHLSQFGSVANLSRVLRKEDEKTARALREICTLTNDYTPVQDAPDEVRAIYKRLRAFSADMQLHVHLENNILYPRAIALEKGECRHVPK